jgi:hypothetical protein
VKELQGRARAELELAPEECFELVATVERYPAWFKVIWRVAGGASTQLELEFDAAASFVPSFLPVGDAGDDRARGDQGSTEGARGVG